MSSKKEMQMSDEPIDIDEAFDLLHDLLDVPEEEKSSFFSSKNSRLLEELAKDIGEPNIDAAISNEREFVALAGYLREREAYWSKRMGEVFIDASGLRDNGDLNGAIELIEEFISQCSSKSYAEIASIQKQNYGERSKP